MKNSILWKAENTSSKAFSMVLNGKFKETVTTFQSPRQQDKSKSHYFDDMKSHNLKQESEHRQLETQHVYLCQVADMSKQDWKNTRAYRKAGKTVTGTQKSLEYGLELQQVHVQDFAKIC